MNLQTYLKSAYIIHFLAYLVPLSTSFILVFSLRIVRKSMDIENCLLFFLPIYKRCWHKETRCHLGCEYFKAWAHEWGKEKKSSFHSYSFSGEILTSNTHFSFNCKMIFTVKNHKLYWNSNYNTRIDLKQTQRSPFSVQLVLKKHFGGTIPLLFHGCHSHLNIPLWIIKTKGTHI